MGRRVAVTGLGTLNACGNDVETSWEAVLAGRSGIGLITRFDPDILDLPCRIAAELKDFDPSAWFARRDLKKLDLMTQYGMAAAMMAWKDAGLEDANGLEPERAGAIIGTGIGGLDTIEQTHTTIMEKGPLRVSPYFVPDDGLSRALALQARLGSDVRVVMPRRSDHRVADMARQRSVRELMAAGVRFFVHRERMIHAKHVLVDEAVAISGSANLDMRSLYLNFELALFGYDVRSVAALESWVDALLSSCEPYQPTRPGPLRRVAEDVCWLAGPLL